jgi:hypothetical protein
MSRCKRAGALLTPCSVGRLCARRCGWPHVTLTAPSCPSSSAVARRSPPCSPTTYVATCRAFLMTYS